MARKLLSFLPSRSGSRRIGWFGHVAVVTIVAGALVVGVGVSAEATDFPKPVPDVTEVTGDSALDVPPLESAPLDEPAASPAVPDVELPADAPLDSSVDVSHLAKPVPVKDGTSFDPETSVLTDRGSDFNTYRNADGTNTTALSLGPTNVKNAKGDWVPIGTDIKESSSGDATVANNPLAPTFADSAASDSLLTTESGGYTLTFSLDGAQDARLAPGASEKLTPPADVEAPAPDTTPPPSAVPTDPATSSPTSTATPTPTPEASVTPAAVTSPAKQASADPVRNAVTYPEVFPGTDLQFQVDRTHIQQLLVLAAAPEVAPTYRWNVSAPGLQLKVDEFGDYTLLDEKGVVEFTISPPIMWDSSGIDGVQQQQYAPVATTVETTKDGYTFVLAPSMDWLTSKSTVYPVSIDRTSLPVELTSTHTRATTLRALMSLWWATRAAAATPTGAPFSPTPTRP